MATRLIRPPSPRIFALAAVAAAAVGTVASLLISRRSGAAVGGGTGGSADAGQVSDAESLRDGPQTIYPDQAVAGYPDSESGGPDEGPAGPNSRPDWQGPGTGA